MTRAKCKHKNKTLYSGLLTILCLFWLFVFIIFSNQIKEGILQGGRLALLNILPTLFPFFILSDFWISNFKISKKNIFAIAFERVFGISRNGFSAYLIGTLFGFPLGVKVASQMYKENILSKEETQRLICFSNNPSAAYVIAGIGIGLLNDIKLGVLLYLAVTISAIIIGLIIREGKYKSTDLRYNSKQKFNFVNSVKNAGQNSVHILSYIVLFSGVNSLMLSILPNRLITTLLSMFTEVSGAVSNIIQCSFFDYKTTIILIAFVLGFSGLSVHFQAFSFFPIGISGKYYLISKLTQGILALIIMLFMLVFI